ncbi:MAG TPA: hypothetical protein DEP71_06270 [Porphyromonadaceae bacterium]|jgi:hypothetical protein|nr:hypothetical protein [Porphyromonadaceae bacterium]HBK42219.1 hypothetical protein [Porphyromonadaceae bacterium]HBQ57601.1 hypothetical protein [Porphyromonadaceae bacterium]HCB00531.1 hypothetical protein [Porphyromonadaceae bacterium]HCB88872.1 hypothetical protein [Porphyromonadaceae bacterium]
MYKKNESLPFFLFFLPIKIPDHFLSWLSAGSQTRSGDAGDIGKIDALTRRKEKRKVLKLSFSSCGDRT